MASRAEPGEECPLGQGREPRPSVVQGAEKFKQFPVGSKVYLREAAAQNVGVAAPEPLPAGLAIENVLMRFDVVGEPIIPDTPPIPNTLVNLPAIPTPSHCHQWRFTLEPPP